MTNRKRVPALKARPKHVDPADIELFRRSVADATPLSPRNKAKLERPGASAHTRIRRDRQSAEDALSDYVPYARDPGTPLNFSRPGVQRQALRKLKRGASAVEDELDLHGLTAAAARPMLAAFLNACAVRGVRRVRIIHGKGLRSAAGEGVLKSRVASWLAQRRDVLAFSEAPASSGGSGAVIVLLKVRSDR